MIIFMDTTFTFIAMFHPDPFQGTACLLLTYVLLTMKMRVVAVILGTWGIVDQDEVVEEQAGQEFVMVLVCVDEGEED